MASQVYSGSGNFSYSNNTGQNVRVVINFMAGAGTGITLNWAGTSFSARLAAIGKNLASSYIHLEIPPKTITVAYTKLSPASEIFPVSDYPSGYGICSNNNALPATTESNSSYETLFRDGPSITGSTIKGGGALPTEIMLAPNQSFSATCGAYNIVVIKEDGT